MAYTQLSPHSLQYLRDLAQHNDRDWFAEHKDRYEEVKDNWKAFSIDLMHAMNEVDDITDYKNWRIYRDVRFSKDKTPYHTHLSTGLTRAKPHLRGGYYLRVTPGGSGIAGGFWGPNKEDLTRVRKEIDRDAAPLRHALDDKELKTIYGDLWGDQLKSAPRGYAKDHPEIALLRYKQYILHRPLNDEQVTAENFIPQLVDDYQAMRPFLDVMTDILTTDENGVSIL